MRSALIYGLLLAAATIKISSMPIRLYDAYLYSYLASGDLNAFKSTPGLPQEYIALSAEKYVEQSPYYRVKPLFIALVRLASHFAGILAAPFLVSSTAFFLTGWGVWLWLRNLGLDGPWRTLASLALMLSSVVTDTAREGMPDMTCTLFLVSGGWLIFSTEFRKIGAALLTIAILVRPDALILAGLILVVAFWQKKLSLAGAIAFCVIMLASNFAVSQAGYPYHKWLAWTIHTSYLYALTHNFAATEVASYGPFLLFALMALKQRFQTGLVAACAASCVIRYVLMPHIEVRYLLPQAMIVGVLAAGATLRTDHHAIPVPLPQSGESNFDPRPAETLQT
jgi:hypothetical protein